MRRMINRMRNCKASYPSIWLVLTLLLASINIKAASDSLMASLFDMPLEELMNQEVSVATKSAVSVRQAPAVVTVITKEEIENMPVRHLTDLLQMVPGFEITPRVNAFDGVGFRGVKDNRYTSRFLIMLDGQPYNHIFYGNALDFPDNGIDINSIEKIEIIRGPGSALYGRNAFLAVVNFITKTGKTNEGVSMQGEYGSFNSYRGYVSYGKKMTPDKHFLFSIGYQNSDGTDTKLADEYGRIRRWNEQSNNAYLNTNLTLGDFTFNVSGSLSHYGTSLYDSGGDRDGAYYSVKYDRQLNDLVKIKATLFGQNFMSFEYFEAVEANDPAISVPATDSTPAIALRDIYPDGLYYNPYFSEYLYGANIESELLFTKKNQLLTGIQINAYGVYDVELKSNINFRTGQYYQGYTRNKLPLDTLGWFDNGRHDYTNFAWYIQDIWYPIPQLGITLGGRLDMDSQIGPVINPRIGLTWLLNDQYNVKLLYGSAYRAPSPSEQYQTLGFAFGNKDLKPETIRTIELALQQNLSFINNQINIFYNVIGDMIYAETITDVSPANTYYNLGTNQSYGVEIDTRVKISNWLYCFANYTYNVSKNTTDINNYKQTFKHVDIAPHKFNYGANAQLPYNLQLSSTLLFRSKMEKFKTIDPITNQEVDVSQNPVGDYAIVNAKVIYKKEGFPLSLYASVHNLLNTEYYSQDNELRYYPPMPGISYLAGVSLNF